MTSDAGPRRIESPTTIAEAEQAVGRERARIPIDRVELATSIGTLGAIYAGREKHRKALEHFDELLGIVTLAQGPNAAAIAEVQMRRARLLLVDGQGPRALQAAERAAAIADAGTLSADRVAEATYIHAMALHAADEPERAGERASKAASLLMTLAKQFDDPYYSERLAEVREWTRSVCKCAPKRRRR